jgi:type II secretory pathway component PulL
MRKLSALAFVLTIAAPLPALAYTQAEADACSPDAFRLCQQAIPDVHRVADCLAQNKKQLSPACNAVFSRPAAASLAHERPGKVEKTGY